MQNLGLSDGTPRTENRLKALFWPSIENAVDADLASRQAFWVCVWVAVMNCGISLFSGAWELLIMTPTFFLAAFGVRERSLFASISVFAWYTAGWLEVALTGSGGGFLRLVLNSLLLTGIRSALWARRHPEEMAVLAPPVPTSPTLSERFADLWPARLWPKLYGFSIVWNILLLTLIAIGLLAGSLRAPTS